MERTTIERWKTESRRFDSGEIHSAASGTDRTVINETENGYTSITVSKNDNGAIESASYEFEETTDSSQIHEIHHLNGSDIYADLFEASRQIYDGIEIVMSKIYSLIIKDGSLEIATNPISKDKYKLAEKAVSITSLNAGGAEQRITRHINYTGEAEAPKPELYLSTNYEKTISDDIIKELFNYDAVKISVEKCNKRSNRNLEITISDIDNNKRVYKCVIDMPEGKCQVTYRSIHIPVKYQKYPGTIVITMYPTFDNIILDLYDDNDDIIITSNLSFALFSSIFSNDENSSNENAILKPRSRIERTTITYGCTDDNFITTTINEVGSSKLLLSPFIELIDWGWINKRIIKIDEFIGDFEFEDEIKL